MKNMKYSLLCLTFVLCLFNSYGQDLENLDEITKQNFLQLKGTFSIGTNYYFSSRPFNQQNPFRYILSGNPVLSIYGFDLPLSFTFANADFSATGPSNFQRMGASPYYKWIKFHAGYRNMSFSPYTLNNHVFLGGGVELNPGKWRIGIMYGRFNDAIEEDTISNQTLPASYKRMGYSVKVGYGTNKNYIEVSMLKAKDDEESISEPTQADISPAENLAIGISTRQTIIERLTWEFHVGASAYTEDITAGEVEGEEIEIPNWATSLFKPRISSRINFAGHTSLTWKGRGYSIKGEYMRVDPEYETMGSYYFNNDLERITIAPAVTLLQGKVNLSGSVGLQRDNLLNNKSATTNRTVGSANLQMSPLPKFTINAQYSNYAIEQESGLVNLNDTVRIFQVNHNINVTPSYVIVADQLYHNFVLSSGTQILVDKNIFTEDFSESTTNNINFNYTLRNRAIAYGLSFGLNYLTLNAAQSDITRYGFSLGGDKALFKEKLSIGLSGMYNLSNLQGVSDGSVINGSMDIRYQPHESHLFSVRGQAILNRTAQQFNDYILSANYTFRL